MTGPEDKDRTAAIEAAKREQSTFDVYCMAKSPDGHSCALPAGHPERQHFGGSPLLPEVEWVWWP